MLQQKSLFTTLTTKNLNPLTRTAMILVNNFSQQGIIHFFLFLNFSITFKK